MTIDENASVGNFLSRDEVEKVTIIEEDLVLTEDSEIVYWNQFTILPNDYTDIFSGERNPDLDLIRAPQAWQITTGNPNVLVGIVDTKVDLNHEDLQGQVVLEVNMGTSTTPHGTGVAGMVAAKTNNNKGIASIANNVKLVSSRNIGYAMIDSISKIPGVKVINCSWNLGCSYDEYRDLWFTNEITNYRGVLVVAAAGNGTTSQSCNSNDYRYPASYESVLSVTGVGNRYPIGYHHNIINPDTGNPYLARSWKDVHEFRPHVSGNTDSHTHNDKVDVSAPGQFVLMLTDRYDDYPSGYMLGIGTSQSAPMVAGVAALIFSVNPNLTPAQVKDIIKSTADDIYHIPYNQNYVDSLGTGRVNAYRAVLTAHCMANPTPGLDMMIRNSLIDYGVEPDNNTQQIFWQSPDIWVRNQQDGTYISEHQNPEYDPVQPVYVYVRVTNRSCETSSGNDELELYWAKANTALNWPNYWDGSMSIDGVSLGGEVATLTIPPLAPGQEVILEFPWMVPNPDDYTNINENPWHFCLLARIVSDDDPMTSPEGSFITANVKNNNNLGWKNTTVVDLEPNTPGLVGGVVAVSNPFSQSRTYQLELFKDSAETGKSIYEEAEIGIEMDVVLYDAWERGSKTGSNFKLVKNSKKVIATGNNVIIDNIQFNANDYGTAYITFNFLTKELTDKSKYTYHVVQRDVVSGEIIGGETYEIRKKQRSAFLADAGGNKEIEKNETVTIYAGQINEDAVYNWYDPEGNLIYTGTDLTVSPAITQKYKLEVISNIDGYKDYDEVEVKVNPYKLQSLVPNPAMSQVTVNYEADEASSAYLMVVNQATASSDNYILDTEQNSVIIDLSGYASGFYSVILVCNGEIQSSKNLVKQ